MERLALSGIKQYAYCKRRFTLMFIDNEWGSNYKIVEGDILHEKVDNPFFNEKRKELYTSRSVPVFSNSLNLYGIADIIEFIESDYGVELPRKKGLWKINPIEYKNGKPEKSHADEYQLCAISMCLEEMFNVDIDSGEIFYGKLRRRMPVVFTVEMKLKVKEIAKEIHHLVNEGKLLPKPDGQNCSLCSLQNACLPRIFDINKTNKQKIMISTKK